MNIRSFFNSLAQPAQNHYTLGELYSQVTGGHLPRLMDDRGLNFTRAGRTWERIHTVVGMLEFGIITGTAAGAGTLGAGLIAACATLMFWKGLGLAAGKTVDKIVRTAASPQR